MGCSEYQELIAYHQLVPVDRTREESMQAVGFAGLAAARGARNPKPKHYVPDWESSWGGASPGLSEHEMLAALEAARAG